MLVQCENCKRRSEIPTQPTTGKRLTCSVCGGDGQIIPDPNQKKQDETPFIIDRNRCIRCGITIPDIRLETKPETRLCIDCEYDRPADQGKRLAAEPLGSRADYKRDRASWKRSH